MKYEEIIALVLIGIFLLGFTVVYAHTTIELIDAIKAKTDAEMMVGTTELKLYQCQKSLNGK